MSQSHSVDCHNVLMRNADLEWGRPRYFTNYVPQLNDYRKLEHILAENENIRNILQNLSTDPQQILITYSPIKWIFDTDINLGLDLLKFLVYYTVYTEHSEPVTAYTEYARFNV